MSRAVSKHPAVARAAVPATFMLHDAAGKVWPPAFVSRLCTRGDPLCMLPTLKTAALQLAVQAGHQARADGAGWGTGYAGKLSAGGKPIEHLTAQQLRMKRPGR
jgi:hypothetical protein